MTQIKIVSGYSYDIEVNVNEELVKLQTDSYAEILDIKYIECKNDSIKVIIIYDDNSNPGENKNNYLDRRPIETKIV